MDIRRRVYSQLFPLPTREISQNRSQEKAGNDDDFDNIFIIPSAQEKNCKSKAQNKVLD